MGLCEKQICDLERPQQRITAAVEAVMSDVLRHTLTETECCLDVYSYKWCSYQDLLSDIKV